MNIKSFSEFKGYYTAMESYNATDLEDIDIDPYDEEWDDEEEQKIRDRSNYFEYDNVEYGDPDYPVGAPVLLKPGDEHRRGLTRKILEPYELGVVEHIKHSGMDTIYDVLWYRRGRIRGHYPYDLLYNRDYAPKEWFSGSKNNIFEKDIYEIYVINADGRLRFDVSKSDVNHGNRKVMIRSKSAMFNVGTPCYRDFVINKKYGYLQDCSGGKYDKNVIFFTGELKLDDDIIKDMTNLIKRRVSSFQAKYTRDIKKINQSIVEYTDDVESDNAKMSFVDNKIDDMAGRIDTSKNSVALLYDIQRGEVRMYNVKGKSSGTIRLTGIRNNEWTPYRLQEPKSEDPVVMSTRGNVLLLSPHTSNIESKYIEKFKDYIKELLKSRIERNAHRIERSKEIIDRMTEYKKTLSAERKNINVVDIVSDFIS